MKKLLPFLAPFLVLIFMFSCQKDDYETLSQTDDISLKTSEVGIEPVLWTGGNGGNVSCEDLNIADVDMSSGRVNYEDGMWQIDGQEELYENFPFLYNLEVEVIDGKYVSWNLPFITTEDENGDYWIYLVGAVIVKGGPSANIYYYNNEEIYDGIEGNWISSDSGLHSPIVGKKKVNIADLSNLTFCIVKKPFFPDPNFVIDDPCFDWADETAFGGSIEGGGSSWWYYFDNTIEASQPIYTGQELIDGAYVELVDGEIIITLGDNMILQDDEESVKIQGYEEGQLPTKRPSAGIFTTYKGNELIIQVTDYPYYVIHLDVLVRGDEIPCSEE